MLDVTMLERLERIEKDLERLTYMIEKLYKLSYPRSLPPK